MKLRSMMLVGLASGVLAGCMNDESDSPLVIERADATSLAGELRTPAGTLHFEATETAARVFDDNGLTLAASHAGDAVPGEWSVRGAPDPALLAELPGLADALVRAELTTVAATSLVDLTRTVDVPADATTKDETAGFANWVYFGRYCGTAMEHGYVGGQNWEYYYRYATVTYYFSTGNRVTYSGWVQPRSVKFYYAASRGLTSAYGNGQGQMSFYNAGNWCS
jgi:hypothetical protein